MKTLIGSWFLVGLAIPLDAEMPQPEVKIEILVYNYAGLPTVTLAGAERETARIYQRAGIRTEWRDCPLRPDEAAQFPGCLVPITPTRLSLQILPRGMAERDGLYRDTFGSALYPEDGGFGMTALVCAPCAGQLAKGREEIHAAILGSVMAHELGHLLLGSGSHGATGLMHTPWHSQELERISQGLMRFTSWESERMRAQILARAGQREAAQSGVPSPRQ